MKNKPESNRYTLELLHEISEYMTTVSNDNVDDFQKDVFLKRVMNLPSGMLLDVSAIRMHSGGGRKLKVISEKDIGTMEKHAIFPICYHRNPTINSLLSLLETA